MIWRIHAPDHVHRERKGFPGFVPAHLGIILGAMANWRFNPDYPSNRPGAPWRRYAPNSYQTALTLIHPTPSWPGFDLAICATSSR
jgi:hypothetical protein